MHLLMGLDEPSGLPKKVATRCCVDVVLA